MSSIKVDNKIKSKVFRITIPPLLGRELISEERSFVVVNDVPIQRGDFVVFNPCLVDTAKVKDVDKLRESLKDMKITKTYFEVTYVFTSSVMKEGYKVLGLKELPFTAYPSSDVIDASKGGETYEIYGK